MKAKRLIVTLICLVQTVLFSVSYSKDYYVKVDGSGTKDGSSWENAMTSDDFAKKLPTAYEGSTFYLAEGSYQPCYCGDYEKCGGRNLYTINTSVKIIGGFSNNAKLGDKNDPDKYPTIMNATYKGSSQMLFIDGENPVTLYLEGLRMKSATIAVLLNNKGKLYMDKCVVDSTSIITPYVESIEISNTKFCNIKEGASYHSLPLIIDHVNKVVLSNVSFSDIGNDIICPNRKESNLICDSLIMKDVTVRNTNGNLFAGDVHYGLFENLDAESGGMNVLNSSDEIIIRDSKLIQTGLTGSSNGIYFAKGKKLSVTRSSILGYQNGIMDDYSSTESVISLDDVTISCNKNSEGVALYLLNNKSDVVVNNSNLLDAKYGVELVYANSLTVKNSTISGNSECGIYVIPGRTANVNLENNIIGLTRNADERYPNKVGVYACAGNFTAKDNIVAGNDSIGIHFFTVYNNIELSGNYIGTNRKFEDFGNGSTGIVLLTECASSLDMAPKNLESANYIGYNGGDGVHTGQGDLHALGSTIRNNYIGVTPDGHPMPNKGYGISAQWNSYPYRTVTSELYIDHNQLGFNKLGDIKEVYAVISKNVFHGNSVKAIHVESKSLISPIISDVKVEDGKYVVYGSVSPDPRNSAAGVTVELYCTNNEKESALKYIASVNADENNRFSFVVDDMPDVDSETSCFVAVAIYNEDPIAENHSYTTELSEPYCVCTPAPIIIEKSVSVGTPFTVDNRKFYPTEAGHFEEVITSTGEDGCLKKTVVKITVVPGKIPNAYYVKVDGTGDGSSWEDAMSGEQFTSICGSVPDSTTFFLAEGDYEPMKVYGYSGFYLNSDIRIIGGYPADAKTGAKREKGKYSTIDASGLGVKSYLFRRLNYNDTLNIYLEGLAMKNVMNAIEGDPGSEIIVEDCLFDNAPLVFNKSSHVEINNSTIQNITEESEVPYSIEADSVVGLYIRGTKFKEIEGNVFKPTTVVDNLTMENDGVDAKVIQIGSVGSGSFDKVVASAGMFCEKLLNNLSINESSFPRVSVKAGKLVKITNSTIEGEGIYIESDSTSVENSKITNKGASPCIYTIQSNVTIKSSVLSGGSYGVYYRDGSVNVEDSYIYSCAQDGIASDLPTYNASSFKPLILKNNYIGLNEKGEVAGNKIGVSVSANKFIAIGNIISGNESDGIVFRDVNEVVIECNYIGTDRNYRNLGNGGCGIDLHKIIGNGMGSAKLSPSSFDKANVIGFNGGDGVIVSTSTQRDESYISHNYIGVAPDGTKIPNKGYGVRIVEGYNSNLPATLVENQLGYNEAGDVSEGFPFKISKNIFHGNASKAIDKTYATFYNNFDPVIKSVSVDGDNYIVQGVTAEHAIVDVELYGTNSTPQSAMVYLGKVSLSTSDLGNFSFTVPMEKMSKDSLTCFVATVWSESYRFTTELSAPYCLCGSTPEIVEEVVPFGQPSQYFGNKYDSFFIGERRDTITSTEDGCTKVRIESFSVAPLEIKDYFVKENGTGDGSSWENAMSGEAFAAYLPYAPDSSTFRFAAGTYQPSLDINLQKTENAVSRFFLVRNDVSIVGGYPTDAKDGDESDPENNPTVFSGNIPGNAEEGTTDDSTTYLFYIDMGVNEVRFEGVEIAHARNGVCADLAPQSNIVVRNSEMNNCDAAVKVTLMLSSLELDNVKFDSNVNAVSSGSIKNTIVKNSTFVNHSGTPLRVLSSGKLTISNSIFEGNQTLPIIAGSTSDVSITSSTISNTLSQGQDEPIIQSSIVKMVNSTLLDNEQGKDWIKADSVVMYHNTLLGISGLVGNIFVNSSPVSTFNANILGFDSLPSTTTELLDNNVVGLTKGELPQTADSRLLSKDQVDLLFYKENDKFLLTNRGGLTPVVALRTDTLENGKSIRIKNTGVETDQRGEERPELTCMGAYEYLQPVVIMLSDSMCFGETIYQNNGFDIVLEDSVSGVFEFDRVVATERLDTSYYLTLKVKPRLKLTNVLVTPSTCISEPNGQLTFDVEGWEESISYMSYVGEVADTLSPLSVVNAVASFRVDGVKDKTFTVHVENKCGIKNETIIALDSIPGYSISISEISTTDLRCSYSMDGLIEVVISGGHDSSEFSMRDSFTIARENLPSNPDTITIDNLGPGIYNFSYHSTVEGCPDEVVASHQIKAPEPIIFKNSIANATCYGLASGELDIVPLRNGDSIKFVDENMSINYASAVLDNKRTDYSGKFGDIDSIGFSLVSLDSSVNMYGKTQDQFFNDALKDAVILTYPMDSMSQHNSTYTEFKYPQSWLGYTAMYPGVYKIEVRDVKGCYFEQNFEIKNPENPLAVTMDHTIDKCDADKRRVELRATGGWAPYQFIVTKSKDWGNQEDNDNKDLTGNQGGVTVGQDFEPDTSLVIDGDTYIYRSDILPLDTINIMVMDKKGCVDTVAKNMIVDANIKVIGEEISDKCAQPKDHSIKVNLGAEYANKPHSYKIRCAQKDSFLVITEFKTDEEGNDIISGLPSGKVGVFAYADGCSGYSTVEIIGDTSLSFIPYVAMKLDSVGSCPDAATGELELKVYGSYPPYHMYMDSISDASLLTSIDMYDTISNGYAQIVDPTSFMSTVMDKLRLRNLPGGSHTVKVVDSEGCEKNIELNLKESDPIEISAAASPVCPGEEFARVYVESVTGGTAPYLFALDDSTDFNDNQFKKVLSGTTHSIAVKDANGCVNKSELIPPSTKGLAIDSIDCVVTNWHSIDDVVVFIDITNTKDIDSVSFSIKAEDLPQGVSYEIIDPDYFRYGLMPGDTVEWKNGKTYYGPLWSIPDEIVSCVLSEAEYDKEYDRLGGLIDSLEVLIKNTSDTSLRNGYQMLLTSQEERLNSICTKDEVLEVFTTELLQDSSIERMQFIRLLTDSVIESSDSVLFSYAFTQTLYVEGCDLTIEYNGLNGKNPNHVENGDQHYASLTTKDILDLIAAPNPTIPGDECTIAVTLKSKKDVYCDVYGLNGGVSSTNELSIKADSYDWEQSDSNFICKFKVKLSETAIVRVRTATDAASVVVLVNPSER